MLVGIVGKANVGKSTFFKALTLSDVEIADYPFTTIKPNQGVGFVRIKCPCQDFHVKCTPNNSVCLMGNRFLPISLLDVAGLVPGAHEGRGLGNKFLDDLSSADVLLNVVDASGTTDEEGRKTTGYDPIKEVGFLREELNFWFFKLVSEIYFDAVKLNRINSKNKFIEKIAEKLSGLKVNINQVKFACKEVGLDFENPSLDSEVIKKFSFKLREISKPILISCNKIDMPSSKENILKIKSEFPDLIIVPCSAQYELALRMADKNNLIEYIPGDSDFKITGNLNEKQKEALFNIQKFIKENNGTGVQECLNKAVFDVLSMKTAFPVEDENKLTNNKGAVLPDGFLLEKNATVLDFAEKVHSAMAKNFIRAVDCRTKKIIGRDYVVKDRDVLTIKFNG